MNTEKLNPFHYPATQITKNAWGYSLISFNAEAGDLKTWSGVYRKEINEKGYQRILSPEHSMQIKKFLSDSKNIIPNSVVIAFNDQFDRDGVKSDGAIFHRQSTYNPVDAAGIVDLDTTVSLGILEVFVSERCQKAKGSDDEITLSQHRSAYVIDGQHRISGGNAAGGNIYLPVTAFLGIGKEEQAFHFIVINRKARKVSKHDIDSIIPKNIYKNLQSRLVSAGIVSDDADIVYGLDNNETSPFKGMINWANNKTPTAVISKGAIDSVLKYVRQLPNDVQARFDNDIDLLIPIWTGIRRHLNKLWCDKNFAKNINETYANQFILKSVAVLPAIQIAIVNVCIVGSIQIDDNSKDQSKSLEDSVYNWFKGIPPEFFYCKWNKTSITNESSTKELAGFIVKAVRMKKMVYKEYNDWFSEPESIQSIQAKKVAEKQVKASQKKDANAAKVKAKKAKVISKARTATAKKTV